MAKFLLIVSFLATIRLIVVYDISDLWSNIDKCLMIITVWVYIANALFLYETLMSQNRAIIDEKKNREINDYERIFYNMLTTHRIITDKINACYYSLDRNSNYIQIKTQGQDFFKFAIQEIQYIDEALKTNKYLDKYDKTRVDNDYLAIEDKYNRNNPPDNANMSCFKENEENEIRHEHLLQLINSQYDITKSDWEKYHDYEIKNEICYKYFYKFWHAQYENYVKYLYLLMQYSLKSSNSIYLDIIVTQLSSNEILFLKLIAKSDKKWQDILSEAKIINKQYKTL